MALTPGSTVFITGAAAGIGRATALAFARRGCVVGAYDVDEEGLESLSDEIVARGGRVRTGRLDVTAPAEWQERLAEFTAGGRRLDVLVNNAGVLSSGRFEDIPADAHRRMLDINVGGTINGLLAAFPYLKETPGAQVVNLASASAIYGQPELATYGATKFAVRGLTEALDLEWSAHDIRVIDMWPLFVRTGMVEGMSTGSTRSLGIRLTAQDVADAIVAATEYRGRIPKVHFPVGVQARVLAAVAGVTPAWLARTTNRLLTRSRRAS
ncbi:NAD(P)-dependent dehydrogenase (short-subunit alcohol dehydrogenase family) [Rhodococcus sp. LBL1]|nr:NAD(P)-dependent dehydrogenase (short-subunit alcohol dehydrogenase family) [Rhodococcus sp. LBL1]MDH6682293.1 NAD(P)-dependent dehydrogenase (short-subunit alcohol dehydrogenase family) [Rhodococcus sp. LBL2]